MWGSCWSFRRIGRVVLEGSNVSLLFNEDGNDLAKFDISGSLRVEESCNVALFLHFKVDDSLVSFDGGQDVTRANLISNLFMPLRDISLNNTNREKINDY